MQLLQRSPCRYRLLAPSGRPFTCKLLPLSRQPSLVTAQPAPLVYVLLRPLPSAAPFPPVQGTTGRVPVLLIPE